jgi:beta-glucanase (GH16 family)
MLPTENYYGGWAASGEIDILELIGHTPSKVYGTIHYGGAWPDNLSTSSNYTLPSGDFSNDFHVFAIEWDTAGITWFVDSVQFFTVKHGQPFDKKFHWLLNVAVGGNWPGVPDATTVFPVQMVIDYVRVYQNIGTSVNKFTYFNKRNLNFAQSSQNNVFTISGRNCGLSGTSLQPLIYFSVINNSASARLVFSR